MNTFIDKTKDRSIPSLTGLINILFSIWTIEIIQNSFYYSVTTANNVVHLTPGSIPVLNNQMYQSIARTQYGSLIYLLGLPINYDGNFVLGLEIINLFFSILLEFLIYADKNRLVFIYSSI